MSDRKIVVLLEDLFEDLEFWYPSLRMREEGYDVVSVAPRMDTYHGKNGLSADADATGFFSIRDDMENAGARWVDQEVAADGQPDHLPQSERSTRLLQGDHRSGGGILRDAPGKRSGNGQ